MQNLCRDTLVWRDVPFRVFSSCRASNSFLGSDEAAAREPRRSVPSRASFDQRGYGPSIGVLLCRAKDYEVAEYAMNSTPIARARHPVRDQDDPESPTATEAFTDGASCYTNSQLQINLGIIL